MLRIPRRIIWRSCASARSLSENEYFTLSRKFGNIFKASSGAEAVQSILQKLDMKKEVKRSRSELEGAKDPMAQSKLLRRLKMFKAMIRNGGRPEWMIMNVLPVLPPDLRPMVALDGGRYATSDLNDLYRRVINRNNRLKKLLEIKAPDVIVRNEKRMLQEAVDALIDNSARFGTQQLSAQRRPLRSLADMLKGKQGRFRQNLLGKRVDYSGRSVIVVGPKLKLDQMGIPKRMALELFRPFVISEIIKQGLAHNIRSASRFIEEHTPEVLAILEEIIKDKHVLLNRAPTLHRLSVQAFRPQLVEGLALKLPPLVCAAFNADFDGDQMAVHLPLSDAAQQEAREIMSAGRNLAEARDGRPHPGSVERHRARQLLHHAQRSGDGRPAATSGSYDEALLAYHFGRVNLHTPIMFDADRDRPSAASSSIRPSMARLPFVNDIDHKKEAQPVPRQRVRIPRRGCHARRDRPREAPRLRHGHRLRHHLGDGGPHHPAGKERDHGKADEEVELIHEQYAEGLAHADRAPQPRHQRVGAHKERTCEARQRRIARRQLDLSDRRFRFPRFVVPADPDDGYEGPRAEPEGRDDRTSRSNRH